MKRILVISNSFGEDATKYLHQVAGAAGEDCRVVNLYIGGCSLEQHWQNIESDLPRYQYQLNGVITERHVSIATVVAEEPWDVIVTQQASHDSGWMDTYEPFLGLMTDFLRRSAPQAQLFLQETWAYEIDSTHSGFARYHRDQQEMYHRLHSCYTAMAEKHGLGLIPSGTVIQAARQLPTFHVQTGGLSLCRDGFHMSFVYGRYLLACVWARTLLGIDLTGNAFTPASPAVQEPTDETLLAQLRQLVAEYSLTR